MIRKTHPHLLIILFSLVLAACANTEAAIATGIAQTQQISRLETAAAGGASTPTPQATEEPAATEESAASGIVTKQDLNMRAGDSTAYGIMTVIPGGETVEVIGINQAGTWYQVLYHNAVGWISVDFTTGRLRPICPWQRLPPSRNLPAVAVEGAETTVIPSRLTSAMMARAKRFRGSLLQATRTMSLCFSKALAGAWTPATCGYNCTARPARMRLSSARASRAPIIATNAMVTGIIRLKKAMINWLSA